MPRPIRQPWAADSFQMWDKISDELLELLALQRRVISLLKQAVALVTSVRKRKRDGTRG
jgi:hypothetical protein